jgi:hypothetical protein
MSLFTLAETTGLVDGAVTKMVENAPIGAGILIVVIIFMRYIQGRDAAQEKRDTLYAETIKEMGESCHANQEKLAESYKLALQQNQETIKSATQQLGRSDAIMSRIEDRISA